MACIQEHQKHTLFLSRQPNPIARRPIIPLLSGVDTWFLANLQSAFYYKLPIVSILFQDYYKKMKIYVWMLMQSEHDKKILPKIHTSFVEIVKSYNITIKRFWLDRNGKINGNGEFLLYRGEHTALFCTDSFCNVASSIDSAVRTLFSISASEAIALSCFSCTNMQIRSMRIICQHLI